MGEKMRDWVKPAMILAGLGLLTLLVPAEPIDPWSLINPRKIATMIFALVVIQAMGSMLARRLGVRTGALLTGFFGCDRSHAL